ncbi:Uncharacterised protein [Mycobacterium tuberculosis]|nr:Uncharacterised protein [Mycobacterium tuberculosis]
MELALQITLIVTSVLVVLLVLIPLALVGYRRPDRGKR